MITAAEEARANRYIRRAREVRSPRGAHHLWKHLIAWQNNSAPDALFEETANAVLRVLPHLDLPFMVEILRHEPGFLPEILENPALSPPLREALFSKAAQHWSRGARGKSTGGVGAFHLFEAAYKKKLLSATSPPTRLLLRVQSFLNQESSKGDDTLARYSLHIHGRLLPQALMHCSDLSSRDLEVLALSKGCEEIWDIRETLIRHPGADCRFWRMLLTSGRHHFIPSLLEVAQKKEARLDREIRTHLHNHSHIGRILSLLCLEAEGDTRPLFLRLALENEQQAAWLLTHPEFTPEAHLHRSDILPLLSSTEAEVRLAALRVSSKLQ